jgi:hypothetical protein
VNSTDGCVVRVVLPNRGCFSLDGCEGDMGVGTYASGPTSGGLCYAWQCKSCRAIKYGVSSEVEPRCRCEKEAS